MSDLIVKNIAFVDELGERVEWSEIESKLAPRKRLSWPNPFSSHLPEKERLLKQIIRKHLVSQGMTQDGARVEICRAYL